MMRLPRPTFKPRDDGDENGGESELVCLSRLNDLCCLWVAERNEQ